MSKFRDFLCDVGLVIGVWLVVSGGDITLPGLPSWLPSIVAPQKATAVTYVYEKDDTAVPNEVRAAIDKLNQRGIVANVIDDDVLDGNGQIPEQYKVAIPAARQAGLPSLVATSGQKVLKVTKDPKTEEQVNGGVP